jgi:hypothetical protein
MPAPELESCANQLRAVLGLIEAGELEASTGQITYLRGALETIEFLLQPRRGEHSSGAT